MATYLVDVNLPDQFSLWHSAEYDYVKHYDATWDDTGVWAFARQQNLTIITKDRDFYDRILLSEPPPRVIYIRCGNLRIRQFYTLMHRIWEEVSELSRQNKLVMVFADRLEAVE